MKIVKLSRILVMVVIGSLISFYSFASSELNSLDELEWEQRLVLINVDSQPLLNDFMWSLDNDILADYRLSVFALINDEAYQLMPTVLMKRVDSLDSELQRRVPTPQQVVVVGLDGSIKATYRIDDLTIDKVMALINTMPMRQVEIDKSSNVEF